MPNWFNIVWFVLLCLFEIVSIVVTLYVSVTEAVNGIDLINAFVWIIVIAICIILHYYTGVKS